MVKQQISNLRSRVRFSYPAPDFRTLTQLVEFLPYTQAVGGSSPSRPTKYIYMIEYITTFFALFFTDVFYTYYLRAIQNDEALKSSVWAVVVFFIASIAVINYTSDHMLLIPACLGAFCGTFVGMKIRKKKE